MSLPPDGIVRLEDGIGLADIRTVQSGDGQYLLVYCRQRIVGILCAMGSDVDMFEFGDAGRMTLLELIERCGVDE